MWQKALRHATERIKINMSDQNHEKTPPVKSKKPSAYDEPFGIERTDPFAPSPAKKAAEPSTAEPPKKEPTRTSEKPREEKHTAGAEQEKKTSAPKKSSPTRKTQSPVKKAESASDAPEKDAPRRTQVTTAQPKKSNEKPKKSKHEHDTDKPRSERPAHKVLPYIFFVLALFIGITLILNLFCNLGNSLADNPSDHWVGVVGYGISFVLNGLFGPAVLTLPLLLVNLGIYWKRYVDHKIATSKIIVSLLFVISLGAVIHVFGLMAFAPDERALSAANLFSTGVQPTGGGLIGGGFGYMLYALCRFVGALIIGFLLILISLFYVLGMTPQHVWNYLRNRRKSHPKRKPTYSEESAQAASDRAKMEEKIRRTTAPRQASDIEEEDFESEAPIGAIRVVQSTPKKTAASKIAPMPLPRLDPNDGDDLFVPDAINEKMARMEEEESIANELAARQAAAAAAAQAAAQKPIDPASNRDAAVEPIFPKMQEGRAVRRVPRADRSFDLKTIFEDPIEPNATAVRKHAPVPPEVPLSPARPRPAVAQDKPAAKPAAPTQKPTAAPHAGTVSVAGSVRTPAAQKAGAQTAPPASKTKPAAATVKPTLSQATPQNRDFGLSNEEFEKLEAQQVTLPRAGEAKKPAPAAAQKKPATATTAAPTSKATTSDKNGKPKRYVFPPISYLHAPEPMSEENLAEIQANMEALATMLKSFHVAIEDNIRYACGPTVTRYEITPAPGVRVRSITNLADDIALALRAPGKIRIEAPIPGTNAVGIEVPNRTRSTIFLRELIESKPFQESKNKLTSCLGAGVAGEPLVFEINKMPHLLVAGTTNSGKSVCINTIIMSLIYRLTPDEIKFVMIDPKKVEFAVYQNIPHLMAPVVTAPTDAAGALQASVEEMERRYELFAQVGVRDIKGYAAATENDPDMPHLPYIVIIIDELADLMMSARDEVETAICRIAQKARAAGMHLIIGTQRPSADVVTGLIKSNVPSRIAFTVKSQIDSRVILDAIGAESLTGMSDMLFVPVGAMRNERVQGAFVSDKEVEKICEFIRATNGTAEYDTNFITKLKELASQCGNKGKGGDFVPSGDDGEKGADSKYADAVRIAIEEKRISTSLLQRKLEIGYSRAAKLIDRMQSEGYVSPPDGSKPRTVLITAEQYMENFVDNPEGETE